LLRVSAFGNFEPAQVVRTSRQLGNQRKTQKKTMKNIKSAVIKNHLTKVCLGAIVFALAGCGHSFMPAPTDSEVQSACYKSGITIVELISGQSIDNPTGQTISEDQMKQMMQVTKTEKGTPRVSGATEVPAGIPEGTDLFPTRVTISFSGGGFGKADKTLDLIFYKNDHDEWIFTPENNNN
jgi:hypothetical protein